MMRFARFVSIVAFGLAATASPVRAQAPATPAATPADSSRFWAAFDFGATFGHKSSGFLGGEAGGRITGPWGAFIEGGQMKNVGTESLDERAQLIASSVGGTASASYRVNYFDGGVRYSPTTPWRFHPYLMFGVGVAEVTAETVISVNGQPVPPESLGIQFGNDLNGVVNKTFIVFGGGAQYPFGKRYFVDGSFRYGRILPNTSEIENDTGINTQRLSIGAGIKF